MPTPKNQNNSDNRKNPKNKKRRLAKYEKRIEGAQRARLVAAYALRAVRDEELYPDDDFESHVKRRWGFTLRRAQYLIKWSNLHESMEPRGHERLPLTESEARPLTTLDAPESQDEVWRTILGRREGDLDRPVARAEVAAEVKAFKDAKASQTEEDGGEDSTYDPSALIIQIPGRSPLVDAYGRVVGDPPEITKGQGRKSERPLVRVPGTLFEAPTKKVHLVEADRLPFELTAGSIRAVAAEFERLGLGSVFNTTNARVDWARYRWGAITGCWHGCPFCYARPMSQRYFDQGFTPTFNVNRLAAPALTPVPDGVPEGAWERRVFVASMGDLMSKAFPDALIQAVIDAMAAAPQWTFLTLTKLPARLVDFEWPLNVWVGASVVQPFDAARTERAMERVKATLKWASLEPLLGPIRFEDPSVFDWFVVGSQTRTWRVRDLQPDPEWVYDLPLQAERGGTQVFMKENLRFIYVNSGWNQPLGPLPKSVAP